MSPIANKTAIVVSFVVCVILAYGHGYRSGRNAQLSLNTVIKIAKAQFECKMEMK